MLNFFWYNSITNKKRSDIRDSKHIRNKTLLMKILLWRFFFFVSFHNKTEAFSHKAFYCNIYSIFVLDERKTKRKILHAPIKIGLLRLLFFFSQFMIFLILNFKFFLYFPLLSSIHTTLSKCLLYRLSPSLSLFLIFLVDQKI